MVNLMNLEILLTWIDFDGFVESGGPFKFGDSDDTGKFGDLGRYGGSGDYGVYNKSSKGRFQKPESRKLSVKGGGGVPPLSVNFSATDCPLRGERGTPTFR